MFPVFLIQKFPGHSCANLKFFSRTRVREFFGILLLD